MLGNEGGGGLRRDPHLSFLAPGARNILFPPGEEFAELMVLILQTHSRERESEGAELDSSANADESRVTTTAKMARRKTFCTPSQSWVFLWLSLSFFSLCCKSWRIFMIFLCDISSFLRILGGNIVANGKSSFLASRMPKNVGKILFAENG